MMRSRSTSLFKEFIKNTTWLIPFISFLCGYLLLAYLYKPKEIPAPALVGKQVQAALKETSACNLALKLVTEKHDPDLPNGTVVSQTPLAGTHIKEQQSIFIVTTSQPDKIVAPDCLHQPYSTLQKTLSKAGIQAKTYSLPSDLPSGLCIAQYPSPGTPLEKSRLTLYLATNADKPVIWPNLTGQTVAQARSRLADYGLTPHIMQSRQNNSKIPTSQLIVIDQRPLAGTLVKLNEKKLPQIQLQVN